jgi:uncharacterized membrane protein
MTSQHISGYTAGQAYDQVVGHLVKFKDLKIFQAPNPGKGLPSVLESLSYSQPEHSPAFYVCAYYWAKFVGSDVRCMRALPAFISLFQLPCIFWLGMELFTAPLTAGLGVALLALSPIQVFYAQEVREYSLITVAIALTSASFLRALKNSSWLNWAVYLLSLVFGLYSSILTGLVVLAHFIFMIVRYGLHWNKHFAYFLASCALSALLFAPWLVQMAQGAHTIVGALRWLSTPIPLAQLSNAWLDNMPKIFVDLGNDSSPLSKSLKHFILAVEAYSIYFIVARGKKQPIFLIITLLAVPALAFIVLDLAFGGQRSLHLNYMMPIPVATVLAVAYMLKARLGSKNYLPRFFWSTVALAIFACEITSCVVISQTNGWYGKSIENQDLFGVAAVLNQDPEALLVSERGGDGTNFMQMLALSHIVKPDTYLEFYDVPTAPTLPQAFNHFYLFNPSPGFLHLLNTHGYVMAPAGKLGYFWIVATLNKPG